MSSGISYGWQVENSSGTPVSGAKIFFKIKGTSTNATTYTDSALTVPAANPVVADAAGWFAVYLSPTVNYDIQIKSADESITYQSTSVSPSATGSQPVDATLTALAALGLESRKLIRGTGVDTGQLVTLSTASGIYYVEDYGAAGNNSTDDRVAIQAAIDAAETAGGGTVWITQGKTYLVSNSGNSLGSRNYAIALKSGVIIDGGGTIARHGTSMAFTLIAGFGTGTFPSVTQTMGIQNITVDGRASTRVDGGAGTGGNSDGFSIWLFNVRNAVCQNVTSLDAASWGVRIERCIGGSFVNRITCRHGADVNADGVHFVDCRNMAGNGFEIISEGDDAFIVEANSYDVYGLNLTGISVRNPSSGVTSARRAILILRDTSLSTTVRNIFDNIIEGVVYESDFAALYIKAAAANVYGNTFRVVSHESQNGLEIAAGDALATGAVFGNRFEIVATDPAERGVSVYTDGLGGTIEDNVINGTIYNPGDGFSAVLLLGDRWQGSLSVDYDPAGTKASPSVAINCANLQDSDLSVSVQGGTYCLRLEGTSDNNTFRIGSLTGGVTGPLLIDSGSTGNTFIGGRVSGTVTNNGGTTNQFVAVNGVSASLVSPDPIAWTPTIDATSGTITTSSSTFARYRTINRTVYFSISITITDNGTGASGLRFTLPTGSAQFGGNCTARNSTTGVGLIASFGTSGTTATIQTTAGAYPVASGQTVLCTGWYFLT
jgi:hypothetical protein